MKTYIIRNFCPVDIFNKNHLDGPNKVEIPSLEYNRKN